MAWNNLKLSLVNAIFPNTTKLIDAETHQDFESELIDAIGALQYRGTVIPSTNLGYIDGTAWVLAKTAGTYANFSGQTLVTGDIAILKFDGTVWTKDLILNTTSIGGVTAANNGLSLSSTTVQLGHAASGTGASDFTANRFLYTGAFDLETRGAGGYTYFDGSTGRLGLGVTTPSNQLSFSGVENDFMKLSLYSDGGRGFGTSASDLDYYTDGNHKFYTGSTANAQGTLVMSLAGTGIFRLQTYGIGTHSGTPTRFLASTSAGDIIERSAAQVLSDIGAGGNFWNRTGTTVSPTTITDNVGIGIATATELLHIFSSNSAKLLFEANNNAQVFLASYNASPSASLSLNSAKGTKASPTHITSGQSVGVINFNGYRASSSSFQLAASINVTATQDYSGAAVGSAMIFSVAPTGFGSATEVARFSGYNLGISETTPTQRLHVTGNIRVTGAYYDSANSAGTNTWLLSSTGTGTAWVNPSTIGVGIMARTGTVVHPTTITNALAIGQTTQIASAALSVKGDIAMLNGLSASNFTYGYSTLNLKPSAGSPGALVTFNDEAGVEGVNIDADAGDVRAKGAMQVWDGTQYSNGIKKTGTGAGLLLGHSNFNRLATTLSTVIGSETLAANAILELVSTTSAFVLPRMTTTQRDAMTTPTNGSMVYNTTTNKFNGYENGAWVVFTTS